MFLERDGLSSQIVKHQTPIPVILVIQKGALFPSQYEKTSSLSTFSLFSQSVENILLAQSKLVQSFFLLIKNPRTFFFLPLDFFFSGFFAQNFNDVMHQFIFVLLMQILMFLLVSLPKEKGNSFSSGSV